MFRGGFISSRIAETAELLDGRAVRRSLNKTGRYVRTVRDDADSLSLMDQHGVGYSTMGLVAQMRENGNMWQQGEITVKLANAYGYCWGVERAVQMAYEARKSFPDRKLYITNEIIHNPEVNQVWHTSLCACRVFFPYLPSPPPPPLPVSCTRHSRTSSQQGSLPVQPESD